MKLLDLQLYIQENACIDTDKLNFLNGQKGMRLINHWDCENSECLTIFDDTDNTPASNCKLIP